MKYVERKCLYVKEDDYVRLSQGEHTIACETKVRECLLNLMNEIDQTDTDMVYAIGLKLDMCTSRINAIKEKYAPLWKFIETVTYQQECVTRLRKHSKEQLILC